MATKAELQAENEALRNDIAIIAQRIREEAVSREWCGDYDEVMAEVNDQTSEPHMIPCVDEVEAWVDAKITVDLSAHFSIETVDGSVSRSYLLDTIRERLELDRHEVDSVTLQDGATVGGGDIQVVE